MYKKSNKKIGVKDIAKAAGVSLGTVDRVLHNRGEVKKETREKIRAIVKELGYQPNVLAKSLASKTTTRIAIVIPDSSDNNPYWKKPILGIEKASNELANYNIEINYKYFDASSEKSFQEVLQEVCESNPDGVVLNPIFSRITLHFIGFFESNNIPYVFIDNKLDGVGNLAYFGQNAVQGGVVAAKLMHTCLKENPKILIVKQSKNKVFSRHIESRIAGFAQYFEKQIQNGSIVLHSIEIDIEEQGEPELSLSKVLKTPDDFNGIFVPNSRVFKVANYIEKKKIDNLVTIGYDLVDQNVYHLNKGKVSFLLGQRPEEQSFNAIMSLFDKLVLKRQVPKTTYSPIDIIIKENIEFYKDHKIK